MRTRLLTLTLILTVSFIFNSCKKEKPANVTDTVPNAPSGLSATAVSQTQINLVWTDNSNNETGFKIEKSPNNSTWSEIASTGANGKSYQHTGLTPGTTYYYRVRSYNSTGTSAYSSTANATTQGQAPTVPNPPSNPAASAVSGTQINVSWTDNSTNETGFKVESSPNNSTWTEIATVGANVTNYQNTGLAASTIYYYRIRSYNGAGNSAYTSSVNATTQAPPATIPNPPINPAATAVSSTQINVSWGDNSNNETGFKIERSPNNSTWSEITTVGAGVTSYQNTGLNASTIYYYRIRSYNGAGNSAYTSSVNATTQAPPATIPNPPINPAATAVSSTQINVSWGDNSNNETGFKIERSPNNSTWSEITTVGAGVTSYQNTGLNASTIYYYRIRSYNGAGNSAYTTTVNATTQAGAGPPAAPSNLAATATNPTQISLTWTDNSSNETGFEIQREHTTLSGAWVTVTTTAANATSYTHSSLAETWPGYRIRAVNGAGQSSYTSIALAPAKFRIINNLYSTTISGNDWANLNTMIRVRIGPTESSITANSNTYERLTPYDNVASSSSCISISPAYNSTSSYRDFPVGSYGYGSTYYVYIQCGWWEYFIPTIGSPYWTKHLSNVLCANGTCCCLKWVWNQITNHTSGYFVITATAFGFKYGNYNAASKSDSPQIIDAKFPPLDIK